MHVPFYVSPFYVSDKLAKVLQQQLSGVKVYKLGEEAEKQAIIVRKTADGQWGGLKTTAIET